MKYDVREISLKDGRTCVLRSPTQDDAAEMIRYMQKVLGETEFLLSTPDDFAAMPVEKEAAFIQDRLDADRVVMVTAFSGDKIIATADLRPVGTRSRVQHRCSMGITVLKEYWNAGLGSHLMAAIINSAREFGYQQLELEVISGNRRAISLYLKYGFQVYGRRPGALRYADGHYQDEYLMFKKL